MTHQSHAFPRFGSRMSPAGRSYAGAIVTLCAALFLASPGALAKPAPDSFADLAERLLPSVVNISSTQVVEGGGGDMPVPPRGSPFEEFFKEFMERGQPRQRQRRATSLGSGFIVDDKGHIITNNHVVQDAEEISVVLHDNTRLTGKVVGRDPKTDIAVLKVDTPTKLTPVRFGNSDTARVGDWIIVIGNPFGFGGTVTAGIISARGRDINTGPYDDFIQTDASINRGNSGGPMFNLQGEVIGINTAIFSPSGGNIGIGFAIPSKSAQPVIAQLISHGQVSRGWLGVRIQSVSDEIAETLGLKSAGGALVASVINGGPAAKADIRAGDIIVQFDGKTIDQMRSLPRVVADTEVGRIVPVIVWRDGKELSLTVKVGALEEGEKQLAAATPGRGAGREEKRAIPPLGLSVAAIDDRLRELYDIAAETKGVVVTDVDAAGPASEQNIKPGDVIVEIGQSRVETPAQLIAKVDEAKAGGRKLVLMLVEGEGGLRFVAVRLG